MTVPTPCSKPPKGTWASRKNRLPLAAPAILAFLGACSSESGGSSAPAVETANLENLDELFPELRDHSLRMTSGSAAIDAAGAHLEDGVLTLSSGEARTKGLGDTDFGQDGAADATQLSMTLDVPQGAQSLCAEVAFTTSERTFPGSATQADHASLTIERAGQAPQVVELGNALDAYRVQNEGRCVTISVAGLDEVELTWEVADAGNGSTDTAIAISHPMFTDETQPEGFHAPVSEFDVGENVDPEKLVADPINMYTGDFDYKITSLVVPGNDLVFDFSLYYNTARLDLSQSFGGGTRAWRHSFQWEVVRTPGDQFIQVTRADGGTDSFERLADSRTFVPQFPDVTTTLEEQLDGSLIYTADELVRYVFDYADRLIRIEDLAGNTILLFYDADELLRLVQDTRNNIAVFEYDNLDRIIEVDYNGMRTIEIEWRIALGNAITKVVNPDGLTYEFTYDSDGRALTGTISGRTQFINEYEDDDNDSRVTKQTDADGLFTEIIYGDQDNFPPFDDNFGRFITKRDGTEEKKRFDTMGRLISVHDGFDDSDPFWEYDYDSNDNQTLERDPFGNEWTSLRQNLGNVLEEVDPLGNVTRKTYTPNGDPLTITDPAGFRSIFVYDENSNLIREKNPLGDSVLYAHGSRGEVVEYQDWNGNTWRYETSPEGDLISVLDPMGGRRENSYDVLGQLIEEVNGIGSSTQFAYDAGGRITGQTDAFGNVTTFEYNTFGNLIRETDGQGTTTVMEYDGNNRPTKTIYSDGRSTTRAYDGEGQLSKQTDELGRATLFTYDDDLLLSTTDALGNTITAEYNELGQRISIKDPNCGTIETIRDAMGRITEVIDQAGRSTFMSYDKRSLLSSSTNARGQEIVSEYDGASRPSRVQTPSQTTTFTTDANGNEVETRIERGGQTMIVQQNFDGLDRLTTRTDEHGYTVRHEYDALGNVTRITYPNGDSVLYTYDALSQLVRVEDWAGRVSQYEYDADGRLALMRRPDGSQVTFTYDAGRRLVAFEDRAENGEVIVASDMELNPVSQIESETTTLPLIAALDAEASSYSFSATHELENWDDGASSVGFTYDLDGNLTTGSLDMVAPQAGQVPAGPIALTYEYDAIDRLTRAVTPTNEFVWAHDASGNILSRDVSSRVAGITGSASGSSEEVGDPVPATLTYDEEGRVLSVQTAGKATAYAYGANGLRSSQRVNGEVTRYVYDGVSGNLLEERDAAGNVIARYVHGLGLISTEAGTGESSVYHYDLRGSTVALTDTQNGEITDRYAYDPYGKLVAQRGSGRNPFLYNGRDGVLDDGNGLNFLRSRYYAPGLMRFVHRDRLNAGTTLGTQTLNRYAFAHGNPISAVDSEGDFPWAGALIGATISTGITFISDLADDGQINTDWTVYAGSAVEGAVAGLIPGGSLAGGVAKGILKGAVGGAVAGAVGNVTKQGFQALSDGENFGDSFDPADLAIASGTGLLAGAATGGLSGFAKKIPSNKVGPAGAFGKASSKKVGQLVRKNVRQFVSNHKFWFGKGLKSSWGATVPAFLISKSRGVMRIGLRTGLVNENDEWDPSFARFLAP